MYRSSTNATLIYLVWEHYIATRPQTARHRQECTAPKCTQKLARCLHNMTTISIQYQYTDETRE